MSPASDTQVDPSLSSWSDPSTGVREEARFLGPAGQQILAHLHRPASGPILGGVVICGSLYEDFQVNYRRELLVARELAKRGIATVRFHYRGVGNSDSTESGAITFDSMVADARAATAWLTEQTGAQRPVLCGSRLGALVAAELGADDDRRPLVFWAPLVSGADFFRGMSRASLMAGVRAEAKNRSVVAGAESLFSTQTSVDMLGNLVHRDTYEDLLPRTLAPGVGPGRQVLLVQIAAGEKLTVAYQKLVTGWRESGAGVSELLVRARQVWLVPDQWQPEDDRGPTLSLVEGISGWVEQQARTAA